LRKLYKALPTLYTLLRRLGLPSQQKRSDVPSPIVLCIDDRSHLLELRRTTLESVGYSVKTASGVITAIKVLEETPVAVVLLEYKLEGMDAEAVAFHIKQRFPELPIVLLSAFSEMPERILWLVDEYVMKSEPLEGLVRVIERLTRPANAAEAHKLPPASDGCRKHGQPAA
jgi:CheY-like chemotaxis protein